MFVKGQSGNPKGRAKVSSEVLEIKRYDREKAELVLHRFLGMDKRELDSILRSETGSMLELLIASMVMKAYTFGDTVRLNFLFDRVFGKVRAPESHIVEAETHVDKTLQPGEEDVPIYAVEMSDNGKFKRARPRSLPMTRDTVDGVTASNS